MVQREGIWLDRMHSLYNGGKQGRQIYDSVETLHVPQPELQPIIEANGITEMLYKKNFVTIELRHECLTDLNGFELNFSASVTFSVKGKYYY